MKGIYGIVSCDVIGSTSLDRDALIQLRNDIYSRLFTDIDALCPGFWGRVVRGDTIECCLEQYWKAFRVALMIKCWFMEWASFHGADEKMRKDGVRYSIGIGSMRLIDRDLDMMDGVAIYLAGRNLDYIADKGLTSYFEMDSKNDEVNSLIDNSVMLVDRIVGQSTERQVPILYDRLSGKTEVEIARSLSISQGAVNQRAMNAGWPFIKHTLKLLEQMDYDRYVG
ncbi:MAG: hypothetical protein IJL58_05910 [Bacteroidales bacterium]|nr:hypothetical protein [Bacteroidales bacterium]